MIIFERDIAPDRQSPSRVIPVIEVLDNGRMATQLAPPLPRGLTGVTMQLPHRVTVLVSPSDRTKPLMVLADNLAVPPDQAPALLFRVEAWNRHARQQEASGLTIEGQAG